MIQQSLMPYQHYKAYNNLVNNLRISNNYKNMSKSNQFQNIKIKIMKKNKMKKMFNLKNILIKNLSKK